MAQLSLFVFLFMQSTDFGLGLLAPVLTALVLFRKDRRRSARLLILPLIWFGFIILAAVFAESTAEPKTAHWIGYAGWVMLAAYAGASAWNIITLPRARWIAIACVLLNAPVVFMTWLVLAMAASGTWL